MVFNRDFENKSVICSAPICREDLFFPIYCNSEKNYPCA